MFEFKVLVINKRSTHLSEDLAELKALKNISTVRLSENPRNGDIIVEVLMHKGITGAQGVFVSGIEPLSVVVEAMNGFIRGKNVTVRAIEVLPLGGGRALGVAVSEAGLEAEKDGKRKETPRKQNKKVNAGTDSVAEGGAVAGDRTGDDIGS